MDLIRINPLDNVAVALRDLPAGLTLNLDSGDSVTTGQPVPRGHKIALRKIPCGTSVIKYGCSIGTASQEIEPGQWVHTHNLRTALSGDSAYRYDHQVYPQPEVPSRTFSGFLRDDGRAAIRNELWILPTVGCVNNIAAQLVRNNQDLVSGSIEGLYHFPHPFGCSQMGEDHAQTRRLLAALARHPNAGGVLILGLGCENLTMDQFKAELGTWDDRRVKFLICQQVEDELEAGSALLKELAEYAGSFKRKQIPASELIVGLKCGGSDGLSGITANPTVGRFSDRLIALGGSTVLTEVPEMFGAESILFSRCINEEVFQKAVSMAEQFKQYFISHGQVVYENPSPGNKAGGISTLEDKSCGCVQKGGSAQITDVLSYGEAVTRKGLNLLSGPGNDLVSTTALTAAGAHMILFTTGRGTPFGAPAPTVKISTNTALYEHKSNWIDFDAGTVIHGESPDAAADRLLDLVLEIAGGKQTKAELHGAREISIFKDGVVL